MDDKTMRLVAAASESLTEAINTMAHTTADRYDDEYLRGLEDGAEVVYKAIRAARFNIRRNPVRELQDEIAETQDGRYKMGKQVFYKNSDKRSRDP